MHRITEEQPWRQRAPVLRFLHFLCFLCLLSLTPRPRAAFRVTSHKSQITNRVFGLLQPLATRH
jgi:hypothetical protein